MGSNSSTPEESNEARLREERLGIAQAERIKILEQHQAEWQKAQILEKHFREQKLHEEARLKQERDEWQHQENLRQQQQQHQQQIFHQQVPQRQMLLQQQLYPQQLQQQHAFSTQPIIYPMASVPCAPLPNPHTSRVFTTRNASPARNAYKMRDVTARNVSSERRLQKTPVPAAKKVLPESKPKSSNKPKTYAERLAAANVRCVEWTDVDYIQESHGTSRYVAENIVKLLKDNNTIPFIARYRKDMTLCMDVNELKNIKSSYDRVKPIKQKANVIIKAIDNQGKWTAKFHAFVQSRKSLSDLEQINSMFMGTKGSPTEKARNLGLEIPAQAIIEGKRVDAPCYLVNSNIEGLKTEEQVRDGIICILAEMINKDEGTFEEIKILKGKHPVSIQTNKLQGAERGNKDPKTSKKHEDDDTKYDIYYNFSSFVSILKPRQIFAINRGQARKILSVKVNIPAQFEQDFKEYCARQYGDACKASPLHRTLLTASFEYALNKLVKPSVAKQTRNELTERAEIASMNDYAEKMKKLLLTPPVKGKVLGFYPSSDLGCQLVVVSEKGDVLETETIYPHDADNPKARREAERTLAGIVLLHKCSIFAIGNGTASRETKVFLTELIKKDFFEPVKVVYRIVDEAAISIYTCSREASTDLPDLDANVVSAVCLARRLQNPIAEFLKVEPKQLVTGMNQRNLPEKQLISILNEVIMEAVSFVGVDVNTASISLLKRVAGLNESKAKHIIEWRQSSGPFRTRNDLKKVQGICSKTFEQCAGFIKIMPETAIGKDHRAAQDPLNYLDQTWIHPESYDVAEALVSAANCNLVQLGTKSFVFAVKLFADQNYSALAKKFNTSVETIRIIIEGLSMDKSQDITAIARTSKLPNSSIKFEDLKIGTVLTGVAVKKTDFGVFVNLTDVRRDGLIHKSKMGGVTVSTGQRVEVKVNKIDKERGVFGLTLVKCL